jgi:hypothetical protein
MIDMVVSMELSKLENYAELEKLCLDEQLGHILRGITELYVPFYINVMQTDHTSPYNDQDPIYHEQEAKTNLFRLFMKTPKAGVNLNTHKPTYFLMQHLRMVLMAKNMNEVV